MIVTYSNYHQLHLHVDYIHQKIVFDNNVHSSDSLNFDLAQVNNQYVILLGLWFWLEWMKSWIRFTALTTWKKNKLRILNLSSKKYVWAQFCLIK